MRWKHGKLLGNLGNDFLNGGFGNDFIDGGDGFDRATFYNGATTGVHVDLNLQGVAMKRPSRIHISIDSEGDRITPWRSTQKS